MINYVATLEGVNEDNIQGFFVDWPNPPSAKKHMKILKNSSYFWLAIDTSTNNVIGFINAISDNTLCSYIPLLEVLPRYKSKGIGTELVRLMLDSLKDFYMIDLLCDDDMVSFYKKFDMFKSSGMIIRNYKKQNGV
ncbi:GNAT family N-acetyltransferase [Clostridium sp. C8-1-8]|uniref:GNAT family N-acetyltransferase n=1 Tax=Clostridium sp. C8-1-8 TaxID=2698831 RepID=UPI001920B835|nr:GNAT family N-acetyltransferase [Clostridium sp. C8-1-8]